MLDAAASQRCNLLLNTGPLPDGSIHREDAATLREVGRRLRVGDALAEGIRPAFTTVEPAAGAPIAW
jgi:alpha-L-fucosidase